MKKVYDGERSQILHCPFAGADFPLEAYNFAQIGGGSRAEVKVIKLENILDQIWGSPVPLRIKDTPHYKYITGDEQPLKDYFQSCRGYTWARQGTPDENMTVDALIEQFFEIMKSEKDYLEPPHESQYIMVRHNWHCIDGLRRASILLSNGVEEAPVVWIS